MITEEEILFIRKKLKESARPLFFFDDDSDGVASFCLLYKMVSDAKGVCVKGKPILEAKYSKKVEEFSPDIIFVLDKPMIEQEFLDNVTQEVIWIDHHPLQSNKKVKYFNPRKENSDDNRPTSFWAYHIAKEDVKEALWLAMIGIVGDWNILLADEFRKEYPDLLPDSVKSPPEALFNSKIGLISKIIDFNLKGTTTQAMQSIKVLTRIESPYEILDQTTPRGKYIYKKYVAVNEKYEELKKKVKITKDKIVFYTYKDNSLAISSMLSNELLHLHPDKIIIIAREKENELMLSLRSSKVNIEKILHKALEGINGYGGGHDNACGACVKKDDLERFISNFRNELNNQ